MSLKVPASSAETIVALLQTKVTFPLQQDLNLQGTASAVSPSYPTLTSLSLLFFSVTSRTASPGVPMPRLVEGRGHEALARML